MAVHLIKQIEEIFFDNYNFTDLKGKIGGEIGSRYKFDIKDTFDTNIIKAMEVVFEKMKESKIPSGASSQYLVIKLNQKVFDICVKKLEEKLDGNVNVRMEELKREREGTGNFENTVAQSEFVGAGAGFSSNDYLNNIPAASTLTSIQQTQMPQQSQQPPFTNKIVTKYISLDSGDRELVYDNNSSDFTVYYKNNLEFMNIGCLDVVVPTRLIVKPYLKLYVEQLNGQFIEDRALFSKLISAREGSKFSVFQPVSAELIYDFPQRIDSLSCRLAGLDAEFFDYIELSSIEKSRNAGNVIVSLNNSRNVAFEDGDRVCVYQNLEQNEINILEQSFTTRSEWIYGDFGEVTPEYGDYLHVFYANNTSGYVLITDGTQNGALKTETPVDIDSVKRFAIIKTTKQPRKLFDSKIVKLFKTDGLVDKIELSSIELSDRDKLGTISMLNLDLQISYTFKIGQLL